MSTGWQEAPLLGFPEPEPEPLPGLGPDWTCRYCGAPWQPGDSLNGRAYGLPLHGQGAHAECSARARGANE